MSRLALALLVCPALAACQPADARPAASSARTPARTATPSAMEPRASDPRTEPGAAERPLSGSGPLAQDRDGDGVPAVRDCDDRDPSIHPGAAESCDGVDRNCDGLTLAPGAVLFLHEDGTIDTLEHELAGASADAPAALHLDEPGALLVCPGTVYATVEVRADVSIHGLGLPDAAVLDGAGHGPVVDVQGDGLTVQLARIRLQGGDAEWGGGLSCVGHSQVHLWEVSLVDNTADRGGGLYTDGCALGGTGVQLRANAALEDGGGAALDSGQLTLVEGLFLANHSGSRGGGLSLNAHSGDVSATLHDTPVIDNHSATRGGGLALHSPHKRQASAALHCGQPEDGGLLWNGAPRGSHVSIESQQREGAALWVGDCLADSGTGTADAAVSTPIGDQLFFALDGGAECDGSRCY